MSKKSFSVTDIGTLLACIFVTQLAGGIGAIFSTSQIENWYRFLDKPPLTPPNWVFGPVWTLLYLLMGISLFLIYKNGKNKKIIKSATQWFWLQLILNTIWSIVFFGGSSSGWGLVIIIMLWLAILKTIQAFLVINKWAGWLLVPYILWVTFASYLTAGIWWLN